MKRVGLLVMAIVILALAVSTMAQVRAEVALRAATEQETVKGNLKGAIEAYRKIVDGFPENRAIRAEALVRMAGCYQKLGDAQARQVYERIVREFADQTAAVAAAKAKLNASTKSAVSADLTIRRLGTSREAVDAVSNDGTKSLETDWTTGNVMVRELSTGRLRPLTTQPPGSGSNYDEFGETAIFSPDGTQAAYVWCTTTTPATPTTTSRCDGYLRISRITDGAPEKPRVVYAGATWAQPYDWSHDGRQIAAVITRSDDTEHLAVISVADGTARVLGALADANSPRKIRFSPDGKYLAYDLSPRRANTGRVASDIYVLSVDGGKAEAVAAASSNDLLAGWSPDGTQLLFTSDRMGTVDLFGIRVSGGVPPSRPTLLRADLGAITVTHLAPSGSLYYTAQTGGGAQIELASVDFRSGTITAPPTAAGDPVPGSNSSPQWSPDGSFMISLGRRPNSVTSFFIRSTDAGSMRTVRPDLTAFQRARFGADPNVVYSIGTNGRGDVGLFSVDLRSGGTALLTPGVLSQLWVTPDGRRAHFFRTGEARHRLIERDLTSGAERELMSFESSGVPAAAQLSSDGKKLYYRKPQKGATAPVPASTLLERDMVTGEERLLLEGRLGLLFLSPDGRSLAVPQTDPGGKWRAVTLVSTSGDPSPRPVMRIESSTGLGFGVWAPDSRSLLLVRNPAGAPQESWWAPVFGGSPRKLPHFIGTPAIHPDGRRIAFQVNNPEPRKVEIWVMERFLPAGSQSQGSKRKHP